ncbi:MAG TPA: glycosyltransferase [Candidatus Paceibacterota bacterium]|nr:glycosyltransferase [Candidatus Paceibacterota bacterium]
MRSVSLVLPATDETYSLAETAERAASLLRDRDLEFLMVTSPKLTTAACRATIEELRGRFGEAVVAFDQSRPGIGGAIQEAFARAKGAYVVLMASDLETDPAVLPQLVATLDAGADIAATSRWRGGAHFTGYHPVKLVCNYLFQLFFRTLYWTRLTDLTYAYRAYRAEVLKGIRWEETRFPFLFETIVKPLRLGYRAVEISAPWRARTEGVSHADLGQIMAYAKVGLRVRFLPLYKLRYSSGT